MEAILLNAKNIYSKNIRMDNYVYGKPMLPTKPATLGDCRIKWGSEGGPPVY
jgi:hypothetical protein